MKNTTTLGVFPVTESRTGYVHTAEGVMHVSSVFAANKLHPRHQVRPWNEVSRITSHKKLGAPQGARK